MSRIFNALRRVEQMKDGPRAELPEGEAAQGLDVLKAFAPKLIGLGDVKRVTSRPHPQSHVLGIGERDRAGAERFKLLRYRLYQIRKQRTLKTTLIVSSVPQDGKTMVAANLAATLAQASDRVLLVDADLRKPSLHSLLGLNLTTGLSDILRGSVELITACRRVDPWGIYFLAAGSSVPNPVELLQRESMHTLVNTATTIFDWVVIDSPPILPLADGRFLASISDAVLYVAREGHTRREELQEGLAALKSAYCAGIILNSSKSASRNSYYYAPARQGNVMTSFWSYARQALGS